MSEMDIPDSWACAKWSDVIDIQGGGQPAKSYFKNKPQEGYIRLLQIRDFKTDDHAVFIPLEKAPKKCVESDILIGRYGASIGRICTGKAGAYNVALAKCIFDDNKIHRDFFTGFVRAPRFQEKMLSFERAAQAGFNKEDLADIDFPLPPFGEQVRIAQKIKATDAKISEIETCANMTEKLIGKYREALLQKAFRGELLQQNPNDEPATEIIKRNQSKLVKTSNGKKRKQDDLLPVKPEEVPFEIPKSWEWVRLGSICTKITDGFHNTPKKVNSGIPYISAVHVKDESIAWETCDFVGKADHDELYAKAEPKEGDILVVNIGAGCGAAAKVNVTYPFSFKNVAILKFNRELASADFLLMWLLFLKRKIYEDATSGGCQPFLSLKILNNIIVPLPSILEQNRIEMSLKEKLTAVENTRLKIAANRERISKLKNSILTNAFAGLLVSQNPSEGTGHDLLARITEPSECVPAASKIQRISRRKSK
ncbi:MAG: restriction endonuclease subunit S [Bdellovibrionaceae bacterium]|nr:restriction endonuclease subunit S [Pseudobdellovibrionaceae bacterium]